MDKDVKKALEIAKKRLNDALPEIKKRHGEAVKNSTEEPEHLRSGYTDDLKIRRAIKEQEDEILS